MIVIRAASMRKTIIRINVSYSCQPLENIRHNHDRESILDLENAMFFNFEKSRGKPLAMIHPPKMAWINITRKKKEEFKYKAMCQVSMICYKLPVIRFRSCICLDHPIISLCIRFHMSCHIKLNTTITEMLKIATTAATY